MVSLVNHKSQTDGKPETAIPSSSISGTASRQAGMLAYVIHRRDLCDALSNSAAT
jgi:hypothetical protein